MVNVSIDVTDLGGEARPGDKVVFWRPRMGGSATHAGRVISTAPVTVFLTDGKATVSGVEPGEMTVLLQCRGVESQGPVTVGVPDGTGTVTLRSLIESQFEYAPPIVSAVQEAAANASASEEAAIRAQVRSERAADRADAKVDDAINNGANLVRNEVKQDADRAVSARQEATQSESNAAASENAAASSASNAATSETNAKQSETNAADYAAVATTAATEAVDAMDSVADIIGAKYATQEYVDETASAADWYKGPLGETHLDTIIDTGMRDQLSTPTATADRGYPEGVRGYLECVRQSTAIAAQSYITTSATTAPNHWVRTTSTAHSENRTWTPWKLVNKSPLKLGVSDLDTVTATSDYVQGVGSYATAARNYPEVERGVLKVTEIEPNHIHQTYLTATSTPKMWTRSKRGDVWEDWILASGAQAEPDPETNEEYAGSPYAHMVRELNLRRRMGRVTTGGKAAVTLIFDHGTKNWRDIVHPALIQRGLRATLALNGSLMENGVERWGHDASITWETIKGWHNAGMEIANHGMYHDDAPDVASQLVEIRDSREKLETELGITVDTWVGAGISGTQMSGFYPVTNIGKYAEYTAGRIVLDNHAVAFGNTFTPNYTWPMDGTIPQGPIGQWLDRGDQNAWDNIVSAIDHAVAVGGRTIVRCHPQYMGMPNMYDEQFLLDFLDYLKGRVDNGDLVVLPANKWAVAELGAPTPTANDTGWRNINGLTTVRAEGDIHLIRIENQVTMKFTRFAPTVDLGQWGLILTVPSGFRPDADDIRAIPVNDSPEAQDTLWQNYRSGGQLRMSNHQDVTGLWNMSVSWITHDPWPSILPGTPA